MKLTLPIGCLMELQICLNINVNAQATIPSTGDDSVCRIIFLKRVLADTGSFVPWIAIKVIDPRKKVLIVTQNDMFFRYMKANYGFDFMRYQLYLFTLLKDRKPLVLSKVLDVRNNLFIVVDTTDNDHKFAKEKGVKALRDEYFKISAGSRDLIIMGLDIFFDNNYIIKRNDFVPTLAIIPFQCK